MKIKCKCVLVGFLSLIKSKVILVCHLVLHWNYQILALRSLDKVSPHLGHSVNQKISNTFKPFPQLITFIYWLAPPHLQIHSTHFTTPCSFVKMMVRDYYILFIRGGLNGMGTWDFEDVLNVFKEKTNNTTRTVQVISLEALVSLMSVLTSHTEYVGYHPVSRIPSSVISVLLWNWYSGAGTLALVYWRCCTGAGPLALVLWCWFLVLVLCILCSGAGPLVLVLCILCSLVPRPRLQIG